MFLEFLGPTLNYSKLDKWTSELTYISYKNIREPKESMLKKTRGGVDG